MFPCPRFVISCLLSACCGLSSLLAAVLDLRFTPRLGELGGLVLELLYRCVRGFDLAPVRLDL